jgi:hypothetical protein
MKRWQDMFPIDVTQNDIDDEYHYIMTCFRKICNIYQIW